MTDNQTIINEVDALVNNQLEYETTHEDAGGNYMHMPSEGGWSYNNCDDMLVGQGLDFKGLTVEEVGNLVLDNFEMVSGHIFSNMSKDWFVIDAYPVQEIEVCLNDIYEKYGSKIDELAGEFEAYVSGRYAYTTTDCVWYAVIKVDTIQELINDSISE